jgi:glutathione S-transferase
MIAVYHLNSSRSQRFLGLPYGIKFYKHDAQTNGAPEELKAVHPLGRSPIVTDSGKAVTESAAIIDYVIRYYGAGRLQPDVADPAYDNYVFWMHYERGTAINRSRSRWTERGSAKAPLFSRRGSSASS